MPVLVNYGISCRNPGRLVEVCGGRVPCGRREEQDFLHRLSLLPAADLRTLFLVMGGFMDGLKGYARQIAENMPEELSARCDIFYREHDEGRRVLEIMELYAQKGRTLVLVGHSWGASSLVLDAVARIHASVALLVTLDPVDWRSPPASLPHVTRWVNIYVDYASAPWLNRGNMAARIGRAWEALPGADVNLVYAPGRHSRALDMFREGAQDEVAQVLKRPA
ncbi:MAG TPA: alpha/beta hydrolase [Candidatus Mailhella merdavium]|nr:alpha/beta hydrolase [Candidatus Mailhella merdavium]